jgi:DnaJ-class molecular chaperone
MKSTTKYYVTVVRDCEDCSGQGSAYMGPPCPTCRGTGTSEDAIELTAALTALGILTRLEQVEKTASRAAYESGAMLNGGI